MVEETVDEEEEPLPEEEVVLPEEVVRVLPEEVPPPEEVVEEPLLEPISIHVESLAQIFESVAQQPLGQQFVPHKLLQPGGGGGGGGAPPVVEVQLLLLQVCPPVQSEFEQQFPNTQEPLQSI